MVEFYILAFVTIVSAVFVVTAEKPVHSVVGLLVHFAALAILFFTLAAEFLAVIQIIVYSGAILMLFVFVIALLSSGIAPFRLGPNRLPKIGWPALVVVGVLFAFMVAAASHYAPAGTVAAMHVSSVNGPVGAAGVFGSVADFGKALFTTDLLPFEVTALVLMVAVVGVMMLAGDHVPYVPTRRRARIVEQDMREAILRAGEE